MYAQYLTAPPSILRCLANGQGGIAQGPLMSARGAVGSQDLSPEAADWVTSGVVPSQHTSERGSGPGWGGQWNGSESSRNDEGGEGWIEDTQDKLSQQSTLTVLFFIH